MLRSWQVPCVGSIDERSEEPTFQHRVPAKAIPLSENIRESGWMKKLTVSYALPLFNEDSTSSMMSSGVEAPAAIPTVFREKNSGEISEAASICTA